ncbi:hypothetical protein Ct9H90mP29_18200 [bacterium]|jgi:uncharacterized protein YqeY|nr:MAG: hypothetical protein Ct9H90mP29_18200 [bacterium]|tara:strand:- start:1647 stop:2090 length:444 start_codon:yes stop_codon:yes gene_type:complete
MSFIESIKTDMYSAMKSGDKEKAGTLRTLLAKLKDRQINTRQELTDNDCINVIKTLVKQRKEAAKMYEDAKRPKLAEKEKIELAILETYLPKMMTEQETRTLIENVINETGAEGISDIGKVMPIVMQRGEGKVDGKNANIILRELLE